MFAPLPAAALRRPQGRVLALEGEGDGAVAMAPRAPRRPLPRSDIAVALERAVAAVIARPRLKQGLSPDGTRRQRTARTVIAHARRRLS